MDTEPALARSTKNLYDNLIPRLVPKVTYQSFDWLFRMKLNRLTNRQIARICGVSTFTINRWAEKLEVDKYINMERYTDEYHAWREKVFKRDSYQCVKCRSKEHLQAHHIKPWFYYPKERFKVGNGETLCERCHSNIHPWMKMLYDRKIQRY